MKREKEEVMKKMKRDEVVNSKIKKGEEPMQALHLVQNMSCSYISSI